MADDVLATDVVRLSCPCGLTGIHSDELHDQHARIITDAENDARADAWDRGYACGLGDYGKGDGETVAMNPYRDYPPAPPATEGEASA